MEKLTQQEQVRRQKMQDLIDMGVDPFGHRYDRTSSSGKIIEAYEEKTKEELEELNVSVKIAGRIMTKRRQGKAGFMNIQDRDGQIQIYVRKDEGDFLWYLVDHPNTTSEEIEHMEIHDLVRKDFTQPVKMDVSVPDLFGQSLKQNFVPVVDDRNIFIGIVTRQSIIQYLMHHPE